MTNLVGQWPIDILRLYHGTDSESAQAIIETGINLQKSRDDIEFGRGFYTTTSFVQAEDLAAKRSVRKKALPAILTFEVSREAIADLAVLPFVRASEEFWSLVAYCRSGGAGHGRAGPSPWFDVVMGPVTRSAPTGQTIFPEYDQVSFHTATAIAYLQVVK